MVNFSLFWVYTFNTPKQKSGTETETERDGEMALKQGGLRPNLTYVIVVDSPINKAFYISDLPFSLSLSLR